MAIDALLSFLYPTRECLSNYINEMVYMYSVWITKVFVCSPIKLLVIWLRIALHYIWLFPLCIACYDITPWCYIGHHEILIYLVECDTYVMSIDVLLWWKCECKTKVHVCHINCTMEEGLLWASFGAPRLWNRSLKLWSCVTRTVATWAHFTKP